MTTPMRATPTTEPTMMPTSAPVDSPLESSSPDEPSTVSDEKPVTVKVVDVALWRKVATSALVPNSAAATAVIVEMLAPTA